MKHNVLYVPPESTTLPDLVPTEGSARPPPRARHAATPALFSPSERAGRRFWEFFTAHIRNPNTRFAYLAAVRRFSEWCERRGLALDQLRVEYSSVLNDTVRRVRHRSQPSIFAGEEAPRSSERYVVHPRSSRGTLSPSLWRCRDSMVEVKQVPTNN